MKKSKLFFLIFLFSISRIALCQTNSNSSQPELETGTIENQFDYIISKSTQFKEFKLIRKTSILKVKAHTLDSLKTLKNNLNTKNESLNQSESNITKLESEIVSLKGEINNISADLNSISFLGSSINKSTYTTIVWSIIIILSIALAIIIARLKSNVITTKNSKSDLEKIEIELEKLKKNSLKKEQEIMRKLQDEINKNNP